MSWLAAARNRVLERFGLFRHRLGAREFGVEPLQFGGALVDPLLQELVGRLERLLGLHGLGHVGIGGDDAAVRQPRRADLDHPVGGEEAQPRRLVVIEERGHPLGDEILRVARAVGAAGGVEAHDLVEPDAVTQHRRRQVEQIDEFAVPGGQRQVGVEDGDALARVVERVLQLVAARLDRRRRLVDQLERRLAGQGPRPQQQRQHLPRGGGADGRRQQEFRMADELGARLLCRVVFEPPLAHEGGEGAAGAGRAEIARDRRLELAGGRRRAPQAERLRLRRRRRRRRSPACARARSAAG